MFPIGYCYLNTPKSFKTLISLSILILIIYLLSIVISNIFKLGTSDYALDTFYFGSLGVNVTKEIFVLILFAPISFYIFPNRRKILGFLYLSGLIVAIIGIKRSVLISTILSVIIYGYLSKLSIKYLRFIIIGTILIVLTILLFPSIYNIFLLRLESREAQLLINEENIEKEARYNEWQVVTQNWIETSIKQKLIGSEPFNDRLYYKNGRMLHTDYMIILNGSGIIGLFLWFYIYWSIFKEKKILYKHLKNERFFNELNAVFVILLISQLIISISSTVYAISFRSIIFLFWGSSLGLMQNTIRKKSLLFRSSF